MNGDQKNQKEMAKTMMNINRKPRVSNGKMEVPSRQKSKI